MHHFQHKYIHYIGSISLYNIILRKKHIFLEDAPFNPPPAPSQYVRTPIEHLFRVSTTCSLKKMFHQVIIIIIIIIIVRFYYDMILFIIRLIKFASVANFIENL